MNQNPFIYNPEEYHRDINVINGYLDQQSFYLSKMSGTDIETVKGWLKDKLTLDETFKLKNPNVFYLSREGSKDRYKAQDTLLGYLDRVGDADYPMAPTFTVYLPEDERINLYKTYIQNKKKERKHHKKLCSKPVWIITKMKLNHKTTTNKLRSTALTHCQAQHLIRTRLALPHHCTQP